MYPFWNPQLLLGRVPSCPVEHEQDALSGTRPDLLGEVLKSQGEHLRVDGGKYQPVDLLCGFRAGEGVEVGPLITLVDLLTSGLSPTGDHTLRMIGLSPRRCSSSHHNSTLAVG